MVNECKRFISSVAIADAVINLVQNVSPLVWACHVHNLKDCRRLRYPLHVFKIHKHTGPKKTRRPCYKQPRAATRNTLVVRIYFVKRLHTVFVTDYLQYTPTVQKSRHVRQQEIIPLSESIWSNDCRMSSTYTRDSRKPEMPGSLCQPILHILRSNVSTILTENVCSSVYFSFVGCDALKDADQYVRTAEHSTARAAEAGHACHDPASALS